MATSTETDPLSLTDTLQPDSQQAVAQAVAEAYQSETAVYPLGGQTSLDFGLPGRRPGWGLSCAGIAGVVDYPWEDMTITVEAGITIRQLEETMAQHHQRLPIDAPAADSATLGGVLATNTCGPRRYALGTMRDYVIGITAVDGRGVTFHGGGRVVKNVAGYDFCKLLTGSLGTLAVVTQVTLKVVPRPEASALLATRVEDLEAAERLLAALADVPVVPTAVELLTGPAWSDDPALAGTGDPSALTIVVGFEGTGVEVDWQLDQLRDEWQSEGHDRVLQVPAGQTEGLWNRLTNFPAQREAPLVIQAAMLPSAVTRFVQLAREIDADCSILSHAGSGIVYVRFQNFDFGDITGALIGRLQPAAVASGGHVVVLSSQGLGSLTRQAIWGGSRAEYALMRKVKQQFDPKDILNPGRFIYETP
jgi:glycolate oxidase FAD binding subunit